MIKKLVSIDELYAAFRRDIMGGLNYDRILREAKPVDAVPVRRGRWRNGICDQCGGHAPFWAMASTYYLSNYCPHCGANMGKDDEQ